MAARLADMLHDAHISAVDARLGGIGATTRDQIEAQRTFRLAAARLINAREGYVPSDATWRMACDLLAAMEAK